MLLLDKPSTVLGLEGFALPPFDRLIGVVVIPLGEPRNLVILIQAEQFRDGTLDVNWDAIRRISDDPYWSGTVDVSSSAQMNQMAMLMSATNGAVFFRLARPG